MKSKININLILQINHIIINGLDQQQSLMEILVPNGSPRRHGLELSQMFLIPPKLARLT